MSGKLLRSIESVTFPTKPVPPIKKIVLPLKISVGESFILAKLLAASPPYERKGFAFPARPENSSEAPPPGELTLTGRQSRIKPSLPTLPDTLTQPASCHPSPDLPTSRGPRDR